ncbi:hypothetical protein GU926_01610 [Nibribacter ruber]|uniref:Phosphohistidine phosphatase n=1 Tax=Nibribacter ruber TaxID=2698458 RepID=A0A6P1NZ75_9BACT|nr:histidine phosphatase family protein [Nibribacter ruber]QHL86213.1 hypothetical protein GU926_01610 [Nibribacter ruber]
MRQLLLMRHAITLDKVPGQTDLERELTLQGQEQALAAGLWLKQQQLTPDLVLCSPAVRTQSTLAGVLAGLGNSVPVQTERDIYDGEESDLLHLLETADASVQTLLFVGHNPTIGYLAQALTNRRVSFSPATVLVLTSQKEAVTDGLRNSFSVTDRFLAPVPRF